MAASTPTLATAGAFLMWTAALVSTGAAAPDAAVQKTTNDGVYTKAQADGAKALYDKVCLDCHPFTAAERKNPKDIPLGGEEFFEEWEGRRLRELVSIIALTMPNDGSAVLTDEEAANVAAYILQRNSYPAGKTPLTKDTAAVLERPKK